MTVSGLWVL